MYYDETHIVRTAREMADLVSRSDTKELRKALEKLDSTYDSAERDALIAELFDAMRDLQPTLQGVPPKTFPWPGLATVSEDPITEISTMSDKATTTDGFTVSLDYRPQGSFYSLKDELDVSLETGEITRDLYDKLYEEFRGVILNVNGESVSIPLLTAESIQYIQSLEEQIYGDGSLLNHPALEELQADLTPSSPPSEIKTEDELVDALEITKRMFK